MSDVTEVDRIRAAEIANTTPWGTNQFLSGKNDKKPLVIGLAAHRIAESERCALIVQNFSEIMDAETWVKLPNGGLMTRIIDETVKAIRAQP